MSQPVRYGESGEYRCPKCDQPVTGMSLHGPADSLGDLVATERYRPCRCLVTYVINSTRGGGQS